ncbi:hypothetical protein Tco_0235839 [Tanacetum coccineum]
MALGIASMDMRVSEVSGKGMKSYKRIYDAPSHTKKIFGNMKRVGKGFSGRVTPLFPTMVVEAQEEMGEDEAVNEKIDDSLVRATTTVSSLEAEQDRGNTLKPDLRQHLTNQVPQELVQGCVPRLHEPMGDTVAQTRVINLEKTKTSQAQEITSLKRRVKILEKKGGSRTHRLKRLYKVGLSRRVKSSDEEGLGEEDASKQGMIADIDDDAEINLVSTHFYADIDMFGVYDLVGDEVVVESEVVVKAASTIPVSAATTTTTVITNDEITLAKALAELKSAKLPTTTAATTITAVSTRPRAKGLVIHEQEQASTLIVSSQQPSHLNVQDKGTAFMLQVEEDEARVEADYQLAQRLQAQEQEELTDEEKARLFIQLLEARKKHFAAIRAKEKRNKPPTKDRR